MPQKEALPRAPRGNINQAFESAPQTRATPIFPKKSDHVAEALGEQATLTVASTATHRVYEPDAAGDRYVQHASLGAGGSAEVIGAFDRLMGRAVALKVARYATSDVVARFRHEARLTAALEHPNIVPVYEIGATPEGDPFYAMRLVPQRSLRTVLRDSKTAAPWPLRRRMNVLLGVCRALEYAHARGVVHGDVKPENILIGDFGEVYLADWELAFLELDSQRDERSVRGTPGYIAPELVARNALIDRSIDLFAVGVILYELLTDTLPFSGESVTATLLATANDAPKAPREVARDCPLLLEDLALELLAKNPAGRPPAAEVARRIDEFLEGAREQERRTREAERLAREAASFAAEHARLGDERQALEGEARQKLACVKAWAPVEEKREAWALEKRAREVHIASGIALARAQGMYAQAIGYDPRCEEAHRGLARLHWTLARRAEREQRAADQAQHEALVREHDRGEFAAQLSANARLVVHSVPAGALVVLERFVERDRILVATDARALGASPVRLELPPGSYVLTFTRAGHAVARYPVPLRRGATHAATVHLHPTELVGAGFVHVPAGAASLGGDPHASDAMPGHDVFVDDFAISELPVTFGEYCEFLDALHAIDPALAEKRSPRDQRGSEGMVVERDASGRYVPKDVLVEFDARVYAPDEAALRRLPVVMIDWFDAVAYAKWRSARDGVVYRLPTELEWEKAARGVDGRPFPWGHEFDPSFCKMRDSRPTVQQPEPVGAFPLDVSVYGVRDMAGCVREWVADVVGGATAEELLAEPEPDGGTARGEATLRQTRGGAWSTDAQWARVASRGVLSSLTRGTGLGFRLAKSLRRVG